MRSKFLITLVAVITLCTCIDPYSPKLAGYTSLLSVDGIITDANTSYTVELSRTFQELDIPPAKVTDAAVFITDDIGKRSDLINKGYGIYKSDSLDFRGSIGRTYVLHISVEGEELESDPCLMLSVPDIDSIYYAKDQQLVSHGSQNHEGISIFLNSKEGDIDQYYRWSFEETWKFKVPNPKKWNFNEVDSSITAVPEVKEYCWKSRKSDDILINSIFTGQTNHILGEPIYFIEPDKSDRLLLQYSILISQYSVSKKEFEFWDNLKQVNESGKDIFAKQPFTVTSNIHNINDPKERVLGYFQVSAVKQKRKYIQFKEIIPFNLPLYHYPCKRIELAPKDYPRSYLSPPLTWDDLYEMYCVSSDYYFVEPKYIPGTTDLEKMVFARPECADCEITGIRNKPDYWVDLN